MFCVRVIPHGQDKNPANLKDYVCFWVASHTVNFARSSVLRKGAPQPVAEAGPAADFPAKQHPAREIQSIRVPKPEIGQLKFTRTGLRVAAFLGEPLVA